MTGTSGSPAVSDPSGFGEYLSEQRLLDVPWATPEPSRVLEILSEAALILERRPDCLRLLIGLIHARESRFEAEPAWAEHVYGLRQLRSRLTALIEERS